MKNRNELFLDYKLQHELQHHLNLRSYTERLELKSILNCKRSIVRGNYGAVDVVKTRRGNLLTAHFANLYNCKSLWSCPTCAAYGLNKHRDKITAIINHWHSKGYWACMVTYTVPHNVRESAAEVLARLRDWRRLVKPTRFLPSSAGSITATEFTYNDVWGWHPHLHVLYFIPKANWHKLIDSIDKLRRAWLSLMESRGYSTDEHSHQCIHISMAKSGSPRKITSGDYIAKEIAKLKTGRHIYKSRSPFELLYSDDPKDFDLFIDYALATKGKSRIEYSRGLQKGVDFTQKKTQSESTEVFAEAIICSFVKSDWIKILDDEFLTRKRHRRRILLCALTGGVERINQYCVENKLPLPYPPLRQFTDTDCAAVFEAGLKIAG